MGKEISAEQKARDMLERMDILDAQSFTAGDVVELANLISENAKLEAQLEACEKHCEILTKSNDEHATKYHEHRKQLDAVLRECDELESLKVENAFGASTECAARIRAAIKGDKP